MSAKALDGGGVAPVVCAECGVEAPPDAKGWQMHLGYDPDKSPEAFAFCPECAEREFV